MKFIDIHTHTTQDSEAIQLVDLSKDAGLNNSKNVYYSLGIHPWFVKEGLLDEELKKIEDHIGDDSFLAIGECGLDKVCDTDFKLQRIAFEKQIILSEKYKKPLILHIVKAFNELIQLRLESKAKQLWIVHGFNGSPQLAKQLIDLGIYLSFGFQLGKSNSKASKSIRIISNRCFFLETDASAFSIEEIYALATEHLNTSVIRLKRQLYLNFHDVFLKDL